MAERSLIYLFELASVNSYHSKGPRLLGGHQLAAMVTRAEDGGGRLSFLTKLVVLLCHSALVPDL